MPVSDRVVIIGAGGFGREILDVFDACNRQALKYEVVGYIVEPEYASPGAVVNGKPILGGFDWLEHHVDDVSVVCGVGAPHYRKRLISMAKAIGCTFCSAIHPAACLTRWVDMGIGVVITAGCLLTNQIRLGNHVHLNLGCTIGHDVVIEEYVSVAPGAHVSGNVTLDEGCYIGTGANIIEKIHIGAWSIVGAGSTIIEDVPPNTTVVGVPGRVVKTREEGWHLKQYE